MRDIEKVWNYCEQRKNACDKNLDAIGMDNMLTPIYQNNMGMSTAYWAVQKCIEDIQDQPKTNADRIRNMSDEELAELFTIFSCEDADYISILPLKERLWGTKEEVIARNLKYLQSETK